MQIVSDTPVVPMLTDKEKEFLKLLATIFVNAVFSGKLNDVKL